MNYSLLASILVANIVSGVLSLAGGLALLANMRIATKISHRLSAFAAGVMLGTAFLDLLPEAIEEHGEPHEIFMWVVGGILLFFLLERSVRWLHPRHEHLDEHAHEHEQRLTVPLLMAGDTIHNFLDGIVIGATFLVDWHLGVVTAIAVAAHEIPQEIGDCSIMLHRGLPRRKVILYNLASSFAAVFGGALVFFVGDAIEPALPYLLAATAGLFIYIATSDLMPEMQHEHRRRAIILDTALLIGGVLVVALAVQALAGFHAH